MVNIVYFKMKFFCLHAKQKALLLLFFFSLFASRCRFWMDLLNFCFAYISSFVMQDGMTRIKVLSMDTRTNALIKATLIVKFCMSDYNIPCALEKIVMADLSILITWQTKIIISSLPQSLKPQNLVRWWLTFGGFLSIEWHDPLIMRPSKITRQNKTIISSLRKSLSPSNLIG